MHGNTCGMDLSVAWVSKSSSSLVRTISSRHVTTLCIGRQKEYVTVSTRCQDDAVAGVAGDLTSHHVADDDALGVAIDFDEVKHLMAVIHFHLTEANLPAQGRVGTEQQLLTGLTTRIKSTGDLCTTERAVRQKTAILAGEGHSIGHALVNNIRTHFGEAIDVGLAGAIVAAFNGVVEKTVHAIAIILIVFCGVDTPLRGDTVRTTRAVLIAEAGNIVALLS